MPATNKEGTTILDRHFATPPAITAHAALDAETGAYPAALMEVLSPAMTARARDAIRRWPGYAPTPLRRFDRLAEVLGLGAVHYKDESARSTTATPASCRSTRAPTASKRSTSSPASCCATTVRRCRS